jgi:hypothetical protein
MKRAGIVKQDGPASTYACARDTAASILQRSAASPITMNDGCGGKTFGTARALHTSLWVIWHHIKLSRCEPMHRLHSYARGESQVATFACIQLFHIGAMLPSLHSPNTHT